MRRFALFIGLWVIISSALAADGPFTLEQAMSAPFPSDLVAAPKGNRIAWSLDAQGRRNIWVAEGPQFTPRQLTTYDEDDGQEVGELSFSPDANTIVYVRGGNKNGAGFVPNPTSNPAGVEQAIWVVSWGGGAPRRIDTGDSPQISPRGSGVAYVKDGQIWLAGLDGVAKPEHVMARGRNSEPQWSPNGSALAFVSERGDHSFIAIYDAVSKTLRYVAPSTDEDRFPKWSPDSRQIAFVRRPAETRDSPEGFFLGPDRPQPWEIIVADTTSGHARKLWESAATFEGSLPRMAGAGVIRWAANESIVFASEHDGWQHLYVIPSTSGTPRLLTPGECEYEHATMTPDLSTVVYSANCGDIDRRHLWQVSVKGGMPEELTAGEGIEWSPVVTADDATIAYLSSDARRPAMPTVRGFHLKGNGQVITTGLLPGDFPADKLVAPRQVMLQAADGLTIHGQLFLPREMKPGVKLPAVVFMHGGPMRQMLLGWHNMYYYSNAYAMNQYLASRGYIVLAVNYRSGISYGRAFREAKGRAGRGATEYQDIVAAGLYLRGRNDVDPTRIGLWGGSYGGFLTAMGLARNSDMFAAGVDLHGVHDWSNDDVRQQKNLSADDLKLARESSPITSVEKWRSPVLFIHGDDDRNVDFTQTVDLIARLRKRNVELEQLVFPDEIHDFLMHRSWLAAYHAAADFFDRHLKVQTGTRAKLGPR
ncbi:MAG TPA: prolyl oligopeptidase family serine peptidase [Candidatus Dormibacteraeota bacterium]|nr:prolyl oligopeptidase family serine peptidase [Candidatus Dormibacteraeota bacterium]